jgi:hypothetical protein
VVAVFCSLRCPTRFLVDPSIAIGLLHKKMSISSYALIFICVHSIFSLVASGLINPRLDTLNEASGVKHSWKTEQGDSGIKTQLRTVNQDNLHFPIFALSNGISEGQSLINTILKSARLLGNISTSHREYFSG